jgi:hypothetical protein
MIKSNFQTYIFINVGGINKFNTFVELDILFTQLKIFFHSFFVQYLPLSVVW